MSTNVAFGANLTSDRDLQYWKHCSSRSSTDEGREMDEREKQAENAELSMRLSLESDPNSIRVKM
jgi:hypothetical protein